MSPIICFLYICVRNLHVLRGGRRAEGVMLVRLAAKQDWCGSEWEMGDETAAALNTLLFIGHG